LIYASILDISDATLVIIYSLRLINKKGRYIMDAIQKHDEQEAFNVGPSEIKTVYQCFCDSALHRQYS
jgi:hypothetical protein